MNTLLITVIIVVGCIAVFFLFLKEKGSLDQVQRAPESLNQPGAEVAQGVYTEISKFQGLAPGVKMEISKSLARFVDQEVHKKTEYVSQQVERKYSGIIEEKTKELKEISYKYEAVEKKYETEVKDKKQTEAVVRSISDGLVVVNDKGELLMMNPAAEKLLGAKNAVGKNIDGFQKTGQMISMAKPVHGKDEKEIEIRSEDNTTKTIRASTAVIQNESGQTVGMVSVLTDVTKQKELDELKNKFVHNVSHELRAPLNCIRESINMMVDGTTGSLNEDQGKMLDIAKRNIARLTDLINDLLDLAKLESKEYKLQYSTFRLEGLLHHVTATFDAWAKSKKLTIGFKCTPDSIEVDADHNKLIQVLTNLVSNAMKFTPENGKITIAAKLMMQEKAGESGYVQVTVEDSGVGMSQDDLKKLFQKFVQVSSAAKTSATGTGLGLVIIKEIIDMHEGRVWVESELDKGTKFHFVIPQKNAAALAGDKKPVQQKLN